MSTGIQALRSDAELGLSDAVARANNAMTQIAAINRQLALNSAPDAASATLLDQRDAYIDELSQLMDVRVITSDHNQVNVFTNSGIQLVGTEASQLAFDAQGTMMPSALWTDNPATRTVGTLTLVSPTGGKLDLLQSGAIRSGEIAAYAEMRDQILVEAQAQLDELAAAMSSALSDATVQGGAVTSGAQAGFDIDTAAMLPGNRINLTYTDTTTGKQHRVSIVRVDDPSALPLSNDATADAGDEVIGVDFSGGLAAVASALNARFNGKVNVTATGTTLSFLDDGAANNSAIDAVSATVTRTGFTGGTELPVFTDAATAYSGAITSSGSQTVGLAARITVNAQLLADPSKLVVYQSGTPAGDSTRPNFILSRLIDSPVTFSAKTGIGSQSSPFTGSLSSYLRQVISTQGENAENASSLAAGQEVVVNALKGRVAEGSAVNIDVEMANLLSLQSAYGASARVMSVVKDMMEQLLRI
jgi:flagellar hook-associated protein 1 FlgK